LRDSGTLPPTPEGSNCPPTATDWMLPNGFDVLNDAITEIGPERFDDEPGVIT
jgi:hypothetical protein